MGKSIRFVVPYFGQLRSDFRAWLHTCRLNPTVDWLIVSDDAKLTGGDYDYLMPDNVRYQASSFEALRNRIQSLYDFKIALDAPYKLCDYKVAYGHIFSDEFSGYDFWGYCDMDLIWGDIREHLTEELLGAYDRVGFQGHCTVYRNDQKNNLMYQRPYHGHRVYKDIFTTNEIGVFDERAINGIYTESGIPFYSGINFDTLARYRHNFVVRYLPYDEHNKRIIYLWDNGKLFRVVADTKSKQISYHSTMYVHWQKRFVDTSAFDESAERFLVVPNQIVTTDAISYESVLEYSKAKWLNYLVDGMREQEGLYDKLRFLNRCKNHAKLVMFDNETKIGAQG